ncbi:MAG: undecaprenyl-diphosphate phosphatase [Gammaproteobacteria bacterium]|jgi:undecaprenyl-diphosphatase
MDLFQAIVLAVLQGLTEFLPISSSAHLILVPQLVSSWQDQGLAFDVSVHVGTLSAVLIYFRREVTEMAVDWVRSVSSRQQTMNSKLAWAVLFGTIPVGLAGLTFKDYIEWNLRSPSVIAVTTVVFGLLLWWADVTGKRARDEYTITIIDVIVIGCAQAVALIPGTSRSGITITAGLMLGLSREAAARFSFLLSIPVILLSGGLVGLDLIEQAVPVQWSLMIIGTVLAGVTAYLTIHFFLKLLERMGMLPFVIYRLALGAFLFYMFGLNF